MTTLAELSRQIGELQADMRESAKQRDKLFEKLDEVETTMGQFVNIIRDVAEMKTEVESFKRLKHRGYGMIIGTTILGGGIGGGLIDYLRSLVGK